MKIIDRAKNRAIDTYVERHHIIPRSLGGLDDETNIVNLTAREHFICHLLLTKITEGQDRAKMAYAVHKMTFGKHFKNGYSKSKTYALVRYKVALNSVECSPELRRSRSESAKRMWANPETRKKLIEAAKAVPSEKRKEAALKCSSPEVNAKKSESAKKRRWSEETKKKMSETRKRRFAEDPEYKAKILEKLPKGRKKKES